MDCVASWSDMTPIICDNDDWGDCSGWAIKKTERLASGRLSSCQALTIE